MALTPKWHSAQDADLADVLNLIRRAFSYMDGIVDPPSSVHQLTLDHLRAHCASGEVWSLGTPLTACMLLTPTHESLYLGKLAVAADHQGRGLARDLIALAEIRAKARNLPALDLQSRVELTQNHEVFGKLGFTEMSRSAHPGYAKPTSIHFRKTLP